ncbi:hypothetical protein [Oceanibacterium hippocampi]|uniref:Uncharacterized protein n=1 Tax=Oceanibacterium hippocampi TaxID=745714 RepID=A0A1Y5RQK3_9PROT|nr:hypothetical protein [Oceanibacterium hippocampi]SLN23030.1 hypothetical protein OCH7691_00620 [Oceanibacterium hippocampi]
MAQDSDSPIAAPDEATQALLRQAAEIITGHLDQAWTDCERAGLDRGVFTAAMMATLMQAMQSSLGERTGDALREMVELAEQAATDRLQ